MDISKCWAADFETTTNLDDCRVWAWSMSNVENPEIFEYGTSIKDFFDFLISRDSSNYKLYFHNLKFDGYFLLNFLFLNGYKHIQDKDDKANNTFTTLITDQGQYYQIEVYFKVYGKKIHKVTFLDSMKIFPNFSVEQIAKGFDLPIRKLEIDYHAYRSPEHELTTEEIDYIKNDVVIVAMALKHMFIMGNTKMTIASDAMSDFKKRIIGFRKKFPLLTPDVDADIRKSYRGGFTYANEIWREKLVGSGVVLDVNSLYPSMLKNELPYGEPIFFEGEYQKDPVYPLYVQAISCSFELKENKIPCIQMKNNLSFKPTEYVKSSHGEIVELSLTSPDLELFFEQYDVKNLKFFGGWKFLSSKGLFDDYVDHWINEKIKAAENHNAPLRQISKLLLNSLYGRFGISPFARQKVPFLDENNIVRFITLKEEERESCYIPIAAFVTAYGRNKTIRTSQAIKDYTLNKYGEDRYYYSDTDSIHANLSAEDLENLKDIIKIDDYKLGYWAKEAEFTKAIYIRAKTYIEEIDGKNEVTVAGLPKYLAPIINFDNFKRGFSTANLSLQELINMAKENEASEEEIKKLHHKLNYTYTQGGVVLTDTDFTII